MSSDLQIATQNLRGHTLCICKDGNIVTDDRRGIAALLGLEQQQLQGCSVADVVVGKAAALLFVRGQVTAVFAQTLSQEGKRILEKHNIECHFQNLVPHIINRQGTDICPMEKAVAQTDDAQQAYLLLQQQHQLLFGKK